MKTLISRNGTSVIVKLTGFLNFETTDELRQNLHQIETLAQDNNRVIFDLEELQFVGSSGISAFIQALREFNSRASIKPRYTNVRNEFKRIISAFDDKGSFDFWESTERALIDFDN